MNAPPPTPPDASAMAARHFERGVACYRGGDHAGAASAWREALRADAAHPHALRNLAVALKPLGRWAELAAVLRRLAAEHPADSWVWSSLGIALTSLGRAAEAGTAYRRGLRVEPGQLESLWNSAVLLEAAERWAEAAALWRRVAALCPDRAGAWKHRAVCLHNAQSSGAGAAAGEPPQRSWEILLRLAPDEPAALSAVALKAYGAGRLEEAADLWNRCRRQAPDSLGTLSNLAVCLKKLGRFEAADAVFRRALALAPGDPDLRSNYSMLLLLTARIAEGQRHWEARYEKAVPMDSYFAGRLPALRRRPRWDGQADPGVSLFIHAEQGLGDTIQYVRFAEAARARVGRVTVACQRPLAGLLAGCRGIDRVMLRDDPVPDDHTHYAAMMSLPHLLGLGLDAVAPRVPYLTVDPRRVEARRLPPPAGGGLRVGLVWSGNPTHVDDAARSIPLERLAPLLELPGVTAGSLQKGSGAALAAAGWSGRLPLLVTDDFLMEDTAALILSLDLVITVDTSVAHLAGALGRPVWVLLPFAPDWRWLVDREDSPWYPTMRLFRQAARGDWPGVIGRVAAALASAARDRGRGELTGS